MSGLITEKLLSVIIIAKNEEKKIGDCIASIKEIADEIILIDSGSTDKTEDIAKKSGAKVFNFKSGSYSDWRNGGLEHSRNKWILYIDADERATKELREEVVRLIKEEGNNCSAFAIPRKNIILGKWLKYGGWWPDYVIRLFNKSKLIRWKNDLHEEPEFSGKLGYLVNPYIHIKHDNLSEMVEKTNKWSEIEAKLMFESNHPKMNILRFLSAMFREFWLRMIHHAAFLDGIEGIIYAIYQVWSKFISYTKLWEMQINEKH